LWEFNMSETRILRDRQASALSAADRLVSFAEDGSEAVLALTTTVSKYPTVPGAFFACTPLLVDGPEVEGASATFSSDTTRILYAYNLGTQVPAAGTKIITHSCGGRWTFRYDG
jgi:hypothetical protein